MFKKFLFAVSLFMIAIPAFANSDGFLVINHTDSRIVFLACSQTPFAYFASPHGSMLFRWSDINKNCEDVGASVGSYALDADNSDRSRNSRLLPRITNVMEGSMPIPADHLFNYTIDDPNTYAVDTSQWPNSVTIYNPSK